MAMECPYINFMALYIITASFLGTNSGRGVTHWKLNEQGNSIVEGNESDRNYAKSDPVFALLIEHYPPKTTPTRKGRSGKGKLVKKGGQSNGLSTGVVAGPPAYEVFKTASFHCGSPVNETLYDNLEGIINRKQHPLFEEPDVSLIFKKNEIDVLDFVSIETNLQRALEESPMSVIVCNQIGNYLRIKGNTYHAIECFRKALYTAPNNADILLNLARVLFNLKYLDDAVVLTRKSLEMQPANLNCWLQHFTLGEILKASGAKQEAAIHFKNALDLNPTFQPAEIQLQELRSNTEDWFDYYTYLIIGLLVVSVFLCLYLTSPGKETSPTKIVKAKVLSSVIRRPNNKRV